MLLLLGSVVIKGLYSGLDWPTSAVTVAIVAVLAGEKYLSFASVKKQSVLEEQVALLIAKQNKLEEKFSSVDSKLGIANAFRK